eukprot:278773-Chlamydomonas_euryale.AAC.2
MLKSNGEAQQPCHTIACTAFGCDVLTGRVVLAHTSLSCSAGCSQTLDNTIKRPMVTEPQSCSCAHFPGSDATPCLSMPLQVFWFYKIVQLARKGEAKEPAEPEKKKK